MNKIAAVLFDFDGTLVRLNPTRRETEEFRSVFRDLFSERGIDSSFRPFYPCLDRAFDQLSRAGDSGASELRLEVAALIASYERRFVARSTPCPHTRAAFHALAASCEIGIVSNNTKSCVEQGLLRHRLVDAPPFVPIVAFEDIDRHKPDPQGLLEMARRLGWTSGQTVVYVGDHVTDLEACERFNGQAVARLVAVCVQGGKCRWEDITNHRHFRPEYAVSDLSRLPPLIAALDASLRS